MQKDFKIGLGVGLLFVVGVAVWLCTLPKLSTEARALQFVSTRPANAVEVYQGQDETQTRNTEPQTTNAEQTVGVHIVQKGETLSGISAKYYGSPRYWQRILTANRTTLNDPNRLIPGSRLVIPK